MKFKKKFMPLFQAALLVLFASNLSFGQCAYYGSFSTSMPAPTVSGSPITYTPPQNNAGRRNLVVTNMLAGNTYRVSNCGSGFDTQLTIRDATGTTVVAYNNDNGPACAGTAASIDFVPAATGTYTIQMNRFDCVSSGNVLNGDITVDLRPEYQADIISANVGSPTWCTGESRTVDVTVQNTGTKPWTDASPDINVVAKWNTDGANWADYYVSVDAGGLAPGATQTYYFNIDAKNATAAGPTYTTDLAPGTNNLTFDLVNAGNCTFSDNSGSCGPGNTAFVTPNITIAPIANASVTITADVNPVCVGNVVTFTATPTNGGPSPSYKWLLNGAPIAGANADTYIGAAGSDFVNTDVISCQLISNYSPCLAGSPATSNSIVMTVNNAAPTNTPGVYTSPTINHLDGTSVAYSDGCAAIGMLQDPPGNNILGNTLMTSTLQASIFTSNPDGYVYVRREFKAIPTSDGPVKLIMYFTQEDFDNYNATASGFLSLPTSGNNSDPNIDNFRLATDFLGTHTLSPPLGAGLSWNGTHWVFVGSVSTIDGSKFYATTMPSCSGIAVNNLAATNVTTDAVTATWSSVITTPSWGWYSLRYREVGAPSWTDGGTANNPATSKFMNGFIPGTNYEMQIRRHCSSQSEGPWSASVLFTTLSGGCDSPMVFNTPTPSPNSVLLTWTAVPGAAWYEFEYRKTGTSTWFAGGTIGGAATSTTVGGLTSNVAYEFRGRTFCPSGTPSAWSTIVGATTTSAVGCALPPTLVTQYTTGASAAFIWSVILDAAWYEFRYKETASGTWISAGTLGGAATTKLLNGLAGGTNYDLQARTFCATGIPSTWSSTHQFTTASLADCESAPVSSVSGLTNVTATITWPAIAGAAWFEFRYKESASGTWLTAGTLSGTGTTKTLTGLSPSTQYDYQAKTFCNGSTGSDWSSTLQFTTAAAKAPGNEVSRVGNSDAESEELGVEDISQTIAIDVYPNPTDDIVFIELNSEEAQLVVYNSIGTIIRKTSIKNGEQISLRDVQAGVYFFEFTSVLGKKVKRVVKK